VSAVARNARLSKRRFSGALDAFATAELELIPGTGLWRLEAATLVSPRLGLRADLDRLARASLCCEAVRLLVAEHEQAPEALAALGAALDALDAGDLTAAATFFPRLLAAAGITPDLGLCVRCGRRPEGLAGIDADLGGAVCAPCAPGRAALSERAVAVLAGAPCPDLPTAAAAEALALDWIEAQTGRMLRSRAGLDGPRSR
jgi:DNA repair protein RecO (recombination protein O)